MKVRFWGVRGSIPAPGPETNRYGGNTSCVSVLSDAGDLFILDMGTGLMNLGNSLMAGDFGEQGPAKTTSDGRFGRGEGSATILLTHAHWDHIQGFPFFPPIFVPGNQFRVHGNARSSRALEGILEGQMDPHYSPIHTLKNLGADIEVAVARPGSEFAVGEVSINSAANPHGATTALAFRLRENGRSLVFAPDAGYDDHTAPPESAALYKHADVLIHDCTYTPEDHATRRSRGMASLIDAARVAVAAEVKHLVLFHYDQDYSDDQVDDVIARTRAELDRLGGTDIELTGAREGLELPV